MARMVGLLEAFAEAKTIRKPLGFSLDGVAMHVEEHAAIKPFVRLAYDDGWVLAGFDWPSWDEGRAIAGDPDRVKTVDLLTIRKIITALVRNERFCDGSLQAAHGRGVIQAILQRIEQLRTEQKGQITR